MRTVLVVQGDDETIELLRSYLEGALYKVVMASDGEEAFSLFQQHQIDLAIIDITLPIPIIMLAAKTTDMDRILGLNIGADDFITKPFNSLEVLARINSQLRRYYEFNSLAKPKNQFIKIGELELDEEHVELTKNGKHIKLTATEFKILHILMSSPGRIYTKTQLYEKINGRYLEGDETTIMVHISNIRDKIEDDSKYPKYIKTLRGVGYKIEKPQYLV
ncbi:TPA: response regulator transcription factor [Streptococcus agalactiae]|nr:response regulator transcription factor [Streptococcus agalactiae]